jgi:hypothetical protein
MPAICHLLFAIPNLNSSLLACYLPLAIPNFFLLALWMPDVDDELPDQRPVFIAGSDAHRSFNYSVGLS